MSKPILFRVDQHVVRYVVPGPVFRQGAFKWRPDPRADDGSQVQGLSDWSANPFQPLRFVVTAWDQLHADYVVASLVQSHVEATPHHQVLWLQIWDDKLDRYTGQFHDPVPKARREVEPTLVVATGIGAKASKVQLEKVRELHERYSTVPLIIAGFGLGLTPIALAHTLLMPMHRQLHITPLRSHEPSIT